MASLALFTRLTGMGSQAAGLQVPPRPAPQRPGDLPASALQESLQRRVSAEGPVLIVIAGSNGAGKSTFYDLYLRSFGLPFVNADVIARALHPESPQRFSYEGAAIAETAGRELLARRTSFCMETAFSDPGGDKVQFLRDAQAAGYGVVFLWIRSLRFTTVGGPRRPARDAWWPRCVGRKARGAI